MGIGKKLSRIVLRLFSSSTLDMRVQDADPDIARAIEKARLRATHEMMPAAMIGSFVAALALFWILSDRIPGNGLLWWLLVRQMVCVVRLAHSTLILRGLLGLNEHSMRWFLGMAVIDGISWGTLGWCLTPLFNLEVAVITISMLIGVASMGAMMLQVTMRGAMAFILPLTVPNAFYALRRQDDLGVYCCLAVLGLSGMLLLEGARSCRRIIEMLRLRFESEAANRAKTEALRQSRLLAEAKSRFVATMSHEMRTPLHGILGLVRMVQHEVADPLVQRHLGLIQGSSEHLVSVINDVLDFSKSEAGGLKVREQAFDVRALLDELVETCRVNCTEKGLTLKVSLDMPEHEYVHGDAVRVRQVLFNLLGNAIKFTLRGDVGLHVRRRVSDGAMVFEVSDTGVGIPAQDLPKVFDAFYQSDGNYQRRFGGTGLGLTISRDLCRAMGGDLRCDSVEGQGSVFTCELPLPCMDAAQAYAPQVGVHVEETRVPVPGFATMPEASVGAVAAVAPRADAAQPRPSEDQATRPPLLARDGLNPARILLVEDNTVNALVAQAVLARLGVHVTLVDNGTDAISWVARNEADLILMDCEMPGMDGIEATRRIRLHELEAGRQSVPIVAVTANGADVFKERCEPAGMDDHLAKPYRPEDLAEVLYRHLAPPVSMELCMAR